MFFKILGWSAIGALGAVAATGAAGIGIVGSGVAVGLTVAEIAFIGGAAATTAAVVDEKSKHADKAKADAKTREVAAATREQSAIKTQSDLKAKIAQARSVLDDLEA